jgi:hypothetical protein
MQYIVTRSLILFFLAVLGLFSFRRTTPEEERLAVQSLIEKEIASFYNLQPSAWADCWTQDEHALRLTAPLDRRLVSEGFQEVQTWADAAFKARKGQPWQYAVTFANWHIRLDDQVAWATFDQALSFAEYPGVIERTKQLRCLEKVDGSWRITVAQSVNPENLNTPVHCEAIKTVVAVESKAWLTHDFTTWAATRLKSAQDVQAWNNDDGSFSSETGWQKIEAAMRPVFFTKGTPAAPAITRENWQITIAGNRALVSFDQQLRRPGGGAVRSKEFRVLAYELWGGGKWKIAAVYSCADYRNL